MTPKEDLIQILITNLLYHLNMFAEYASNIVSILSDSFDVGGCYMENQMTPLAQGPAVKASARDLEKDNVGFTNPNLHRRIDVGDTVHEGELSPRKYSLAVYGVDSYRTTEIAVHDESSTTSEIP